MERTNGETFKPERKQGVHLKGRELFYDGPYFIPSCNAVSSALHPDKSCCEELFISERDKDAPNGRKSRSVKGTVLLLQLIMTDTNLVIKTVSNELTLLLKCADVTKFRGS